MVAPPAPGVSAGSSSSGDLVPAQLGFLAIFNPSLGHTDETLDDQIVYYASITTQASPRRRRRHRASGHPTQHISQDERDERLRQIGLAQGMVNFGRGFADGAAVDSIDTEQSRVVLHEMEPGWWIVASIDLTKVPLPPRLPTKNSDGTEKHYEYSSREMKPANLLLRDLLRAHSTFLLHHDSSLSALFVRSRRSKFVTLLSRYWDLYLSTWDVILHGIPTRDIFGGINIAASGELGVGVGEEDRGSGEREVLEGLVGRIEGLVDLVVSKFGDEEADTSASPTPAGDTTPWLGSGQEPGPADGAIFLGTGALSRKSLRDVACWMEDLYTWGDHAYGVIDSPTSIRRAKKNRENKKSQKPDDSKSSTAESSDPMGNSVDETTADNPETSGDADQTQTSAKPAKSNNHQSEEDNGTLDKMVGYLKLGYGTYWSLPGGSGTASPAPEPTRTEEQQTQPITKEQSVSRPTVPNRSSSYDVSGHYLIGLKGEIDESHEEGAESSSSNSSDADGSPESNSRTVLRTVHVELESEEGDWPEATIVRDFEHPASALTQSQVVGSMRPGRYDSHDLNKAAKLRVVVYVNRPFVFTFLFRLRTDSLAWDALYRSLHHQISPLRKHLLASTQYRPERPTSGSNIYDLIWDPAALTVHSSIPNIPEQHLTPSPWSRPDALNTHLHLLNIYAATRTRPGDLERTQKTSRGWWVVWTRLLDRPDDAAPAAPLSTIPEDATEHRRSAGSEDAQGPAADDRIDAITKEIFLIRRASDHVGFRSDTSGAEGVGKLAQGIGVDTRRYVEELLSLL